MVVNLGGIIIMTKITGDMSITELVELWPQTAQVLMQHGMGCLGCAAAHFENIGQGAAAHGIDIESLIADLNKSIE
jgi:hybrid cluster-associated redox disulfide protein